MCGDGANDAPALRQAQMGIAVSTATDVAKAAAGVVLTEPGLGGIVACIKEGRSAFQRVLTYTLTILINKCVTLIVLGAGLIITGHAVLTPLLQAMSMLTNDFVTMARAADRARPSPYPNAWRVRNLTLAAVPLGSFRLLYLVAVLGVGWYGMRLSPGEMQTLTFTMLAFAGQGNVYVLREHGRLWSSRPAPIMLLASLCDVLLVASLAAGGVLDERASDNRDSPARRDDDRLHPGDGLHQARGVRAPADRLTRAAQTPSNSLRDSQMARGMIQAPKWELSMTLRSDGRGMEGDRAAFAVDYVGFRAR